MNWSTEAAGRPRSASPVGPAVALQQIVAAIAAAIALHAGVALWLAPAGASSGLEIAPALRGTTVQVRVMAGEASRPTPVVTGPLAAVPEHVEHSPKPETIAPPPMAEVPVLPKLPAVPVVSMTEAEPPTRTELPLIDGYVLRKALTRAPVPLADVDPSWPDGLSSIEAQTGRFTLFIGEAGTVDRIVPDGPSLFPSLEASAIAAFSAARFQPGEVDGRPVKSVIRIEVVFDPRGTKVPGAAVVSRQSL